MPVSPPSGRGRPRSRAAREAVLRVARRMLEREGPSAITIEAVALQAGVGKPTIYRTWPNAQALTMAALMDGSEEAPAPAETGRRGLAELKLQLRRIATTFASRTGRNVAMMLAAADPDTELAKSFRHHFILARREEGKALLQEALAGGELRPDLDIEIVLDLLYGPIFYRLLLGREGLNETFTDRVLDHALRGLVAESPKLASTPTAAVSSPRGRKHR